MDEPKDRNGVNDISEKYEKGKRYFSGKTRIIISAIAVLAALFHIYALAIQATSVLFLRNIHLMFGLVLIFLIYPGLSKSKKITISDVIIAFCAIMISIYVLMQDQSFVLRAGVNPTKGDIIFGSLAIILIFIATKRVIGWPLVIVTSLFIVYAKFGSIFPGLFVGRNYDLTKIISYVFNIDGIYGIPIGISSTYVILFIIFGAFLKNSGAGDLYTDLSYAIAGRTRGGPAKVSIISSALFGTIAGSGIANVVTSGSITIPLMKRTGFKSQYAAAIEAVASTGGQIMPPIMGAGAFLMAEMIGVPYTEIMIAATIPALLYFLTLFFNIDLRSGKQGLRGLKASELPNFMEVVKSKGHLIIPIFVLLYSLIIQGSTPIRAAFLSIISCIVVSYFKKSTRIGLKKIVKSLRDGVLGSLEVIAACACAGIIMALVSLTGVGLKLSTLVEMLSGSNLFLALVLTAIVVIILSMGLPTTACYLVSAVIMAPALIDMGIAPLQAHMFIFYFACLSGITPPVALVAFPAASLAQTNPISVSFVAFRLAIVAFILPFIFIYSPELLMVGNSKEIIIAFVTSLIGIYAIAAASQGWLRISTYQITRGIIFVGGVLMLIPGIQSDILGFIMIVLGSLFNIYFTKLLKKKPYEDSNRSI